MSNDLISRSAVVVIIENQRLLVGKQNLSVEYNLASLQKKNKQLPVAYDVDKFVKQLEESTLAHDMVSRQYGKDGYYSQEQVEQGITRGLKVAIGIVKAEMKG